MKINTITDQDELLDIVDANDQVIGQQWRSEIDLIDKNNIPLNIRSINAFIENDKGQLWIPRRTAAKKRFPSALDMSVSGCVAAGETYEQAFARETLEEVNIDIATISWALVGYFTPTHYPVNSFMKVYTMNMNEAPDFNPDDFSAYYWLYPQEVMERIKSGKELYKPGLPKLLTIVYGVE